MLRSYIELLWVKREKMKVVCVDSCIRSRAFGIDIALRNRFELFEEMKVPYELWVSEAYADIYSDVGARKRVLECYEALGIDRTKVRFLGLELGGRSVQEFAEEELEPADWLIMERGYSRKYSLETCTRFSCSARPSSGSHDSPRTRVK